MCSGSSISVRLRPSAAATAEKPSYYIVKDSVIDYVLSADYDQRNLKARV